MNLIELNKQELREINGGAIDPVTTTIAVVTAIYGAGYALGKAFYHLTH